MDQAVKGLKRLCTHWFDKCRIEETKSCEAGDKDAELASDTKQWGALKVIIDATMEEVSGNALYRRG